jgi:hypothetical protein
VTLTGEFDILAGSITFTVPDVQPGADYRVVCEWMCFISWHLLKVLSKVFGDSGNWNDEPFEIISADPKLDTASDPNRVILVDQGVSQVPAPWLSVNYMHREAAKQTADSS